MRHFIILSMIMLLSACSGGGNTSSAEQTALCQRSDTNSKIFCALQQDYLWYKQLPSSVDPDSFATPQALLEAVVAPQDRFSYIMTAQEYEDRFVNATYYGFGFGSVRVDNNSALQVMYVYDDGSAAENGMRRGDKIVEIEGVSVATWLANLDAGNATSEDMYGPNESGVVRNFVWTRPDNSQVSSDLIKHSVTTNTVLHRSVVQQQGKTIGYLVFNSFIEISETELEQAFSYFAQQQIDELVIDLRYNGGGYIRVANQFSTQIARNILQGQVFIRYQYNDKNSSKNTTTLFSLGAGRTSVNLDRVFFLTTQSTCSASEMMINSLSPFIDVVQIGETTCGKPVGMQPVLINDYVLSAINFQTVNALNQGEYFDGLVPECQVPATIVGDWGVATDPLYSTALSYIAGNGCSVTTSGLQLKPQIAALAPITATPWQVNNEQ